MADIIPFRGLLYNIEEVKDISKVITPPYDVITSEQIEYFYNLNEFNIVKLILPREEDDKYKKASETLNRWIRDEILMRDKETHIYVVKEEFVFRGIKKQRISFISLVKLEDFKDGSILPHEGTLDLPKKDRFELIKATKANLCPIFGLYINTDKKINRILEETLSFSSPDLEFSIDESIFGKIDSFEKTRVLQKMWKIKNEEIINSIIDEMKNKKILIADGHHRYEASLALKDTYGFVMMQLFNLEDDGIIILPTHRLVKNLDEFTIKELEKNIEKKFTIRSSRKETIFNEIENISKEKKVFGGFSREKGFRLFISLNATDELDVNIIHNKLLYNMDVSYTINADEAITKVEKGEVDYAFFLNPTKIKEVESEANKGKRMPGKSTYFYPKLITGLVINKFE